MAHIHSSFCIYLQMTDKDAAPGPKEEAAMYIRVHTPLHRQAKGRPIALVSVVDNDLANKLLKEGKIDQMEEVNRFVDVIHSQISKVRLAQIMDRSALCVVENGNSARQPLCCSTSFTLCHLKPCHGPH